MPAPNTAAKLLVELQQDLSVCTEAEMRSRWAGGPAEAIDEILSDSEESFETYVAGHNPIWYLARKVIFGTVADRPEFLYEPYHKDILFDGALDYYLNGGEDDNGLIFLGPRDTYKTSCFHGAVPLWILLRRYHLDKTYARLAFVHHKDKLAQRGIKNRMRPALAHNEWLRRVWPEACAAEKDLGSGEELYMPFLPDAGGAVEPSIEAAGMGASLTGSHYDAIFFSDLVVEDHRTSKTLRDETESKHEAMEFLLDTIGGKRFYDGTRYHPRDLWGKLSEAKDERGRPLYRTIIVPAGGTRQGGPLAHPFKWSEERLERRRMELIAKYGNDDFWWMQLQNEIRSSRIVATDPSWLKPCLLRDVNPHAWRLIVVDPAWKGAKKSGTGDFASIQVWFLERKGPFVIRTLIDGVHSNELTLHEGLSHIFRLREAHGAINVAPEETAGSGLGQTIRDEGITRGKFVNVITLKDNTNIRKEDRIQSFVSEAEAGRVFIAEECDPVTRRALIDQFTDFGQLDHDDALDNAANTCDSNVRNLYMPKGSAPGGIDLPWWAKRREHRPSLYRHIG